MLEQIDIAWTPDDIPPADIDRRFAQYASAHQSLHQVARLDAHGDHAVEQLATSPDGRLVAVAAGGKVHIYRLDRPAPEIAATCNGDAAQPFGPIAFVGNERIAWAQADHLNFSDATNGRIVATALHLDDLRPDTIRSFAFTPDGTMLVTGGDHGLCWHDVRPDSIVLGRTRLPAPYVGHGIAFSHDGRRMAFIGKLAEPRGQYLELWDHGAAGAARLATHRSNGRGPGFVAFSADASQVAFSAPGVGTAIFRPVKVDNVPEGRLTHRLAPRSYLSTPTATPGPVAWLDAERYVSVQLDGDVRVGIAPLDEDVAPAGWWHERLPLPAPVQDEKQVGLAAAAISTAPFYVVSAVKGATVALVYAVPATVRFRLGEDLVDWGQPWTAEQHAASTGESLLIVSATSEPDPASPAHALIRIRVENAGEKSCQLVSGLLTSDDNAVLAGEWPVFVGSIGIGKTVERHVRVPIWRDAAGAGRRYTLRFVPPPGAPAEVPVPPTLTFGTDGTTRRSVAVTRKAPPVGTIISSACTVSVRQSAYSAEQKKAASGAQTVTRNGRIEVLEVSADGRRITRLRYVATTDHLTRVMDGVQQADGPTPIEGRTVIATSADGTQLQITPDDGGAADEQIMPELIQVLYPLMAEDHPLAFTGSLVMATDLPIDDARIRQLVGLAAGSFSSKRLACRAIDDDGHGAMIATLRLKAASNDPATGVTTTVDGTIRFDASSGLAIESDLTAGASAYRQELNGASGGSQDVRVVRRYTIERE
ncbi:MAG: WD40 repeat domain-containing protein [Planctomycetota bacterium]